MLKAFLDRRQLGVILACTIGNALNTTAAVHAVFGVFLIPLSQTFHWSRASISAALGLIALGGAIVYPLAGRYADRHGARKMLILGNLLFALALATLAMTNGNLTQFYLSFAAIGLVGAIPNNAVFTRVVSAWFVENRGVMLGISGGVGNSLGSTLMPIIAALLISTAGWRAAYLGVAAIVLIVGLPSAVFLMRDAPRGETSGRDQTSLDGSSLSEAARTGTFWLVLVSIAMGAGALTAVFSHIVPIVTDRGFGLGLGTAVISVFALVCSIWQIVVGRFLDKVSSAKIVPPMYALAAVGLALLALAHAPWQLLLGGACLGIGLGSQYGSLAYFCARYFGLRHFGVIVGVMYSTIIVVQGVTPILLDAAFDHDHSYRFALIIAAALLAMGTALTGLLPKYPQALSEAT
jgi:MFS family permease